MKVFPSNFNVARALDRALPNWIWTFTIATRDWKFVKHYLSQRSKWEARSLSSVLEYFNEIIRMSFRGLWDELKGCGKWNKHAITDQSSWAFPTKTDPFWKQQTWRRSKRMFAMKTKSCMRQFTEEIWTKRCREGRNVYRRMLPTVVTGERIICGLHDNRSTAAELLTSEKCNSPWKAKRKAFVELPELKIQYKIPGRCLHIHELLFETKPSLSLLAN